MRLSKRLLFILLLSVGLSALYSLDRKEFTGCTFTSSFPYPYRFVILNDNELELEWTSLPYPEHHDKSRKYSYTLAEESVFIRFRLNEDIPVSLWEFTTGETEPWNVGNEILGLFGIVEDVTKTNNKIMGITYSRTAFMGYDDIFTVDVPYYVFDGPANIAPLYYHSPSSELREGSVTYELRNLNDPRSGATWVEGSDGDGIGESFEIAFNDSPQYLALINGYISAQNPSLYWKNGRLKTVRIEGLTTGMVIERKLEDTPHLQAIDIRELGDETHARFVIADVYPGECYADTCLHFMSYSDYPIRPLSHPWRRNE